MQFGIKIAFCLFVNLTFISKTRFRMNHDDFVKLNGLLSKLDVATHKAVNTDGTFKKYHTSSIEILKHLPEHLRSLEQGLTTAKIISQ